MGRKKPDIGAIYPDFPDRTYNTAYYDKYLGGVDSLVNTFTNRSQGNDIFDYIKFLFEPQKTQLMKDYGISDNPADVYSSSTGVLPKTLAGMNSRGLLDTGTSGVVEGQVRSNAADRLAELFGQSKQLQRQDIDASLQALDQLYPAQFQVANIPNEINYFNAVNDYNVGVQRNAAQQNYEASQGPKTLWGQFAPQIGQLAGSAIGNIFAPGIGGEIGGQLGKFAGGASTNDKGGSNYKGGSGGSEFSLDFLKSFNPFGKSNQSARVGTDTAGGFLQQQYSNRPTAYTLNNSSANLFSTSKDPRYSTNNISW